MREARRHRPGTDWPPAPQRGDPPEQEPRTAATWRERAGAAGLCLAVLNALLLAYGVRCKFLTGLDFYVATPTVLAFGLSLVSLGLGCVAWRTRAGRGAVAVSLVAAALAVAMP